MSKVPGFDKVWANIAERSEAIQEWLTGEHPENEVPVLWNEETGTVHFFIAEQGP